MPSRLLSHTRAYFTERSSSQFHTSGTRALSHRGAEDEEHGVSADFTLFSVLLKCRQREAASLG